MSLRRSMEEFLKEAEDELSWFVGDDRLRSFASQLKSQFRERLRTHAECMLPSYHHLLPSGREKGQYLALDVGGSTLRVALVALRGREASGKESEIVRIRSFKITPEIRALEGMDFFDWMASFITQFVNEDGIQRKESAGPIPIGLAWSFPVEQTSLGGGLLLGMGKGFLATKGLEGQDLGRVLKAACQKTGLDVELAAIVNDGSATLLSQAYLHASTRFGLILGTGCNIAAHLPVSAFGRSKFGSRPDSWFASASHVIVNTELGMFGEGILPLTRWDEQLNASHPKPGFQPLEHFLSGYYLGEVCRLALVEAIETAGLLGGVVPPSLEKPYSLDTVVLSEIEDDVTPTLEHARSYFNTAHPSATTPSVADMATIRALASLVSRRSSALLAASVFALWELRHETEAEHMLLQQQQQAAAGAGYNNSNGNHVPADDVAAESEHEHALHRTKVAFNGTVIERYPGYRASCQRHLDRLVATSARPGYAVELVFALESSIVGAAVALASVVYDEAAVQDT